MGILNLTPDSFSDGGLFVQPVTALARAKAMSAEGAALIDLGAESSRPGAVEISAEEELARLLPPLRAIATACDIMLSVDTYKAQVADQALAHGADIINDIWGLQRDLDMACTIAKHGAGVVIMHNQTGTEYAGDIVQEICAFFQKSIQIAQDAGIDTKKIILDPGIGFGKTTGQNLEVLARLSEFKVLGFPLLLGTSRKSVVGNTLNLPVAERLEGTLATSVHGLIHGASIFRVHDVQANLRALAMAQAICAQPFKS